MKKILTHLWQASMIALLCSSMIVMTACTVDQVLSDIDIGLQAANVVCGTLGTVLPADAVACQLITGIATTGLNVIQTDYDTWSKSGAQTDLEKIQTAVSILKSNLAQELQALHITNANVVAKVTNWAAFIDSTLSAVLSVLPKLAAAAPGTRALRAAALGAALPTPEALQAQWVSQVCKGDAACGKLVKVHHIHGSSKAVKHLTFGIAN